jgi:hypothetical protein
MNKFCLRIEICLKTHFFGTGKLQRFELIEWDIFCQVFSAV